MEAEHRDVRRDPMVGHDPHPLVCTAAQQRVLSHRDTTGGSHAQVIDRLPEVRPFGREPGIGDRESGIGDEWARA